MKAVRLAIIATAIIATGAIGYADILFPESGAVVIIKSILMIACVPVVLGLILGLLPQKVLRHGILPWGLAIISVGANWLFFGKTWIEVPSSVAVSLILSLIMLGVFAQLGVEVTKAIKEK